MNESQKCTATTATGKPCRNHAMLNQDPPPLCAVHRGRLGNITGNQNALKHGFYRPTLNPDEIAALITHTRCRLPLVYRSTFQTIKILM